MIRYATYWALVIGLQVLVLNHLDISSYIYPQVFIILLITLPLHLKKTYQFLIGFGLGLIMDLFVYTPGIHMSACLWLIAIRMIILGRQDLKEHANNKLTYSIKTAGFFPFFYTTLILIIVYHFYIYWLDGIGNINLEHMLITGLSSSLLAITLIGVLQALSLNKYE